MSHAGEEDGENKVDVIVQTFYLQDMGLVHLGPNSLQGGSGKPRGYTTGVRAWRRASSIPVWSSNLDPQPRSGSRYFTKPTYRLKKFF